MSESERVHLTVPETPENKGENVFCPVEQEFTYIGLGKSTDGMEVEVCRACNEPEPVLRDVTGTDGEALFNGLDDNR